VKIKPRWGPRVPQHKLRLLYEQMASGRVDDELLDDVGITLYARCKSILTIGDIHEHKRLPCPQCGRPIALDSARFSLERVEYLLECPACGWSLPWRDYWATFRHQELGPGGDRDIFEGFTQTWEAARTSQAKILAVDRIIHQWHWETAVERPGFGLGRPTGVNLIEGNRKDVIAFLDRLTYGVNTPPEVAEARDAWRAGLGEVRARQAQWHEGRKREASSDGHSKIGHRRR
jgi:predicted RNA-binding Zn-ribbon protein involved in translation (DUF1610 family)